jgi:hypothetical protein
MRALAGAVKPPRFVLPVELEMATIAEFDCHQQVMVVSVMLLFLAFFGPRSCTFDANVCLCLLLFPVVIMSVCGSELERFARTFWKEKGRINT